MSPVTEYIITITVIIPILSIIEMFKLSKIDRRLEVTMPVVENILELQSVYEVLFNLQANFGLNERFRNKINGDVLSKSVELTNSGNDTNYNNALLEELSKSLLWARDKIITWNVRKSIKELDTTIAMLSAKIKLIQYILGQCDGVELHQVCSLALVYFSNVLEDSVIYNKDKNSGRKTLRDISKTAQLPVWLSHYRNRICHESTMGPCSSILYVLVDKSMKYMERVYWSPILELKTFNANECHNSINFIANDNRGPPEKVYKKGKDKKAKAVELDQKVMTRYVVWCGQQSRKSHEHNLRTNLRLHKNETIQVLVEFLERDSVRNNKRKNVSALFRMIFLSDSVNVLIDQLISKVEAKQNKRRSLNWLSKIIGAACLEKIENRRKAYVKLGMTKYDMDVIKHIKNLSPLQCSRIAYRLVQLRLPIVRRLLMKMRRRLVRALGVEKTQLLVQMTRMVLRDNSNIPAKADVDMRQNNVSSNNIEVITLE